MPVRLVVPDDLNDVYGSSPLFGRLRERCDVTIYTSLPRSTDEVVERIGDAEMSVRRCGSRSWTVCRPCG
jgi:hypothetical protein